VEFYHWALERLGEERLISLRREAWTTRKWLLSDLEGLYAHYKGEHSRVLELRAQGEIDRIVFSADEFFPNPLNSAGAVTR